MSSAKSGNPVLVGQLDYHCTNCVANAPNLVLVGRICRNPERPNFSIVISVAIAIVMGNSNRHSNCPSHSRSHSHSNRHCHSKSNIKAIAIAILIEIVTVKS